MGLNDSFTSARSQILMMNPLPSISQAYFLVKQEEKQRNTDVTSGSFLASAKHATGKFDTNHGSSDSNSALKKSNLKCSYCHKEGHIKENCFKLVGYPPKGRGRGKFGTNMNTNAGFKSQEMQVHAQQQPNPPGSVVPQQNTMEHLQQQVNLLMQMMSKGSNAHSTPEDHVTAIAGLVYTMLSYVPHKLHNIWIIDTGTSNHMCCDKNLMTDIHTIPKPFHVALPNGHIILVNQLW